MKMFAWFTALVFMGLGVLIILLGVYIAISGFIGQNAASSGIPSFIPDLSGIVKLANLIVGGAVVLQGLFLAAIGQVLWLLATIARETELTSTYLYALVRRDNPPKQ